MQIEDVTSSLFWLHWVPLQLLRWKDSVLINDSIDPCGNDTSKLSIVWNVIPCKIAVTNYLHIILSYSVGYRYNFSNKIISDMLPLFVKCFYIYS